MNSIETFLIIVPTYNGADYIEETLVSVKNQSYPHWKLVLVDDGSTDNSVTIARRVFEGDSRLFVVRRKDNAGRPSVPRNQGFAYAMENEIAFDYVAYLDDDDLWKKDKLLNQLRVLQKETTAGLLYSKAIYYMRNERLREINKLDVHTPEKMLFFCHYPLSTVVLRKAEAIQWQPIFDEDPRLMAVEDTAAWIRLLAEGVKVVASPHRDVIYRQTDNSISSMYSVVNMKRQFNLYLNIATKYKTIPIVFPVAAIFFRYFIYVIKAPFALVSMLKRTSFKLVQNYPRKLLLRTQQG